MYAHLGESVRNTYCEARTEREVKIIVSVGERRIAVVMAEFVLQFLHATGRPVGAWEFLG